MIHDWNEVARWEKYMSGVRWNSENRENSEVAWSERWKLMSCQFEKGGRVVSREDGMEFKDKILFYCSREVRCKQRFTGGI